jgi:N6-adenosine-specific RNA methylase IME4
MNFEILLSDPPWHYTDKATAGERGAAFKYPVMSVDDICALDVQAHMAPESACFMWATAPCLPEAFRVMAAWGYEYSTIAFTWVKTRSVRTVEARRIVRAGFPTMQARADRVVDELATAGLIMSKLHIGMGQSTRANAEFVLLGLRGRMGRVDAGMQQISATGAAGWNVLKGARSWLGCVEIRCPALRFRISRECSPVEPVAPTPARGSVDLSVLHA